MLLNEQEESKRRAEEVVNNPSPDAPVRRNGQGEISDNLNGDIPRPAINENHEEAEIQQNPNDDIDR